MGMLPGRARRPEKGAVAVEFALIMPVLVTMLFGMVWTGLAYADHIAVNNAIREGARYGAAADATNGSTWATSVRDRLIQVYANRESTLTNAQICVRLVKSDGTTQASWTGSSCGSAPSTWPPTMATGSCVVEVWASKPRTISLILFPDLHVTIGGNSIAYYGRKLATGCTASP